MILLGSQRHGGMTPMTAVWQWRNTGSLGSTGQKNEGSCPLSGRAAELHGALGEDG